MKIRSKQASLLLLLCLVCLAILSACAGNSEDPVITTDTPAPPPAPVFRINGRDITFAAEGNTDLSLLSIENGLVVDFEVFNGETVYINGAAAQDSVAIDISAITREDVLEIKIEGATETVTHKVNLMPSTFPDYTVEGESKAKGDYYLSTYDLDTNYLFKLNNKGDLIFYKTITKLDAEGKEVSTNGLDFTKHVTSDGKIRYTYMPYLADAFADGDCTGINPGAVVVMDENYNVIDEIYYTDENGEKIMIDPHGFIWLDEGHYILTAYKRMILDAPADLGATDNKVDCAVLLVQEIKNGEVLWTFSSADYEKFLPESNSIDWEHSTDRCYDYVHFNSMAIDKDGNLLLSCRHLDAILKVSRTDGSLIWQLCGAYDDFGLRSQQRFSFQHSIVVAENGDYLLFDNANYAVTSTRSDYSSVIRMSVDEENMRVVSYTRHYVVDYFSNYMGAIREIDAEQELYLWSVGGNYEIDNKTPPEWSMVEYTVNDKGEVEHVFRFRFEEGRRRLYSSNKCE